MICYIKRRLDFKTVRMLPVADYDVVLGSIYEENSTVTVPGEVTDIEGDFIVLDGWLGVVESVMPEYGSTIITAKDIATAFNRSLIPATGSSIEGFIKEQLEAQYKDLADGMYAMPYLQVTTAGATDFISPDEEEGFWSLKSYMAKVRRLKSVFCTWGVDGDALTCAVSAKNVPLRTVDFADGSHRLSTESYSRAMVAKVTAVVDGVQTHYYAHSDGSYSTEDKDRITGEWAVLSAETEEAAAAAVAEAFARSSYSHMIEFYSDKRFDFYDALRLRIKGRVLRSYISSIHKTLRYGTLYRSGELRVTLTDKMKEMV